MNNTRNLEKAICFMIADSQLALKSEILYNLCVCYDMERKRIEIEAKFP